jgi:predicted DNA-binding transcriptional regulator AlpA
MTETRHETHPEVELLDVRGVATLLNCSTRHVLRLRDAGRLPGPVHLGHAIRWRRSELLSWISDGCPPVRTAKGAAR